MAITWSFSVESGVLLVKTSGRDDNAEQVRAYGLAVIAECIQRGVSHVLCDERALEYRLNTVDTYALAKDVANHAPKISRVAIVSNPAGMAEAMFWEDVAVNRGLVVKVFREVEAARRWLALGGSSPSPES